MGRAKGVNQKAEAVRERKEAVASAQKEEAARKAEDAKWADEDKYVKRKAERKQQLVEKSEAKNQRKQENKRLAEEELQKVVASQRTLSQNEKKLTQSEVGRLRLAAEREEQLQRERDAAPEDLLRPNPNRELREQMELAAAEGTEVIDATGIDDIIEGLGQLEPEHGANVAGVKQRAAMFNAYKAELIPKLKEQNPNLKYSQLVQMCFKEWQLSPNNPLRHTGLAKRGPKRERKELHAADLLIGGGEEGEEGVVPSADQKIKAVAAEASPWADQDFDIDHPPASVLPQPKRPGRTAAAKKASEVKAAAKVTAKPVAAPAVKGGGLENVRKAVTQRMAEAPLQARGSFTAPPEIEGEIPAEAPAEAPVEGEVPVVHAFKLNLVDLPGQAPASPLPLPGPSPRGLQLGNIGAVNLSELPPISPRTMGLTPRSFAAASVPPERRESTASQGESGASTLAGEPQGEVAPAGEPPPTEAAGYYYYDEQGYCYWYDNASGQSTWIPPETIQTLQGDAQ